VRDAEDAFYLVEEALGVLGRADLVELVDPDVCAEAIAVQVRR
jgi:hypothetical protein